MNILDVCQHKVAMLEKNEKVQEAARQMKIHHVGDVIVVSKENGQNKPLGILTDRDIVINLVADDVDLSAVTVGDCMSDDLMTVRDDADIADTMKEMSRRGVRRAPVIASDGSLCGILSMDDLIEVSSNILRDMSALITREQACEELRHRHH
ncbi:CBS domain-containing protein [Methylophaga sp.]|uniref:CBS domain-containing protein n=1 Tax=Methylophaga sp. TaxID=2024840 RepID=UPI0013FF3883|nr:CBS domain-containing protein [Methylophaga sp.]MTI64806.1 CBS domain-containing protein [Methylophaga sp.]